MAQQQARRTPPSSPKEPHTSSTTTRGGQQQQREGGGGAPPVVPAVLPAVLLPAGKKNEAASCPSSSTDVDGGVVVIAGAGIVGLVLALALKEHVPGIALEMYEQAHQFHDGIGAGIGMYPNGLRVVRDISSDLLQRIQSHGYPYLYRRWERHDGTEIMCAEETVLASGGSSSVRDGADNTNNIDTLDDNENGGGVINNSDDDKKQLEPMGIRRWKLQKVLYEAVLEANIPIHFKKKIRDVKQLPQLQLVELQFEDGTSIRTRLLLASDGAKSPIRSAVVNNNMATATDAGNNNNDSNTSSKLTYTGTTCLYGHAKVPRDQRGICFPTSQTSKCHGAFFPVSETEQCFQFHFPTPVNDNDDNDDNDDNKSSEEKEDEKKKTKGGGSWKSLLKSVAQEECRNLAEKLKKDGWHDKYLEPLLHAEDGAVLKVPFAVLDPPLDSYVHCDNRVVLLGDSAHPPTPYLGQGAQQGIEDAGTLAVLLQQLCIDSRSGVFSFQNVDYALQLYNKIRVPRTQDVMEQSLDQGYYRQKRAENKKYNEVKEELIKRDVFFHETTSEMFIGATYDYKKAVIDLLHEQPMVPVPEEDDDSCESEPEDCPPSSTLVEC